MSLPEKHPDVADVSDVAKRCAEMRRYDRIWKPERDGHAPPFWQNSMVCQFLSIRGRWIDMKGPPLWQMGYIYRVPAEAVNGPPVKVDFDYATWRGVGLANQDKLPAGVVLPEPTDWADEVISQFRKSRGITLTDFIRTHCQPREVPNG